MRLYESVVIFDPQLKAPEIEENVKKFTNFIANHGGEIVTYEEWGKKRLAYEINRKQYGFYVLMRFNGQGNLVSLLEREYKLNESVLRYLTIQVEKKALQMEQNRKLAAEKEAEAAGEAEKAAAAAEAETEAATAEPEAQSQAEASDSVDDTPAESAADEDDATEEEHKSE